MTLSTMSCPHLRPPSIASPIAPPTRGSSPPLSCTPHHALPAPWICFWISLPIVPKGPCPSSQPALVSLPPPPFPCPPFSASIPVMPLGVPPPPPPISSIPC